MYRNRIMREERVDFIKETKAMAEANPYVRRELTLKNRLMASVIIYLPARLSDSLFKLFTNIKGIS